MRNAAIINFNNYYQKLVPDGRNLALKEVNSNSNKEQNPKKETKHKKAYYIDNMEQLRDLMQYFIDNKRYLHHLIFNIEMGTGRRIGDIIGWKNKTTRERESNGLTWLSFYTESGDKRKYLYLESEQKTGKHKDVLIGQGVWDAIRIYCENTGCEPCGKDKYNSIALQLSGTYKGQILSYEGYRKGLKQAAKAVGIEVNVASHTARKQAGTMMDLLHPNEKSMDVISSFYGHSSNTVTEIYMGHRQRQEDAYVEDLGKAQSALINGEEIVFPDKPLDMVSLEYGKLRELIQMAYQSGMENSNVTDIDKHMENVNTIMDLVKDISK